MRMCGYIDVTKHEKNDQYGYKLMHYLFLKRSRDFITETQKRKMKVFSKRKNCLEYKLTFILIG